MTSPSTAPLWSPKQQRIDASQMMRFINHVNSRHDVNIQNYDQLHNWSVTHRDRFWDELWNFSDIQGHKVNPVLINGDQMPGAKYFPGSTLNFAQNLLCQSGSGDAIVFWGEDKIKTRLSWDELNAKVSKLQQFFSEQGVKKGDRVAAMLPNVPEAIIAMLAASSLGAIWSSCSPDFGEQGILDRFEQIEPMIFLSCDGYWYNGKEINIADKVAAVCSKLQTNANIIVSYIGGAQNLSSRVTNGVTFSQCISKYEDTRIEFTPLPFDHPLYILFSSGTTGVPKCIVHSQGGILLQHIKEHQLHGDINPGDKVFHFTTCGWMMWNWLVSALASKATLMLYDGSPFYPDGNILFDYAQAERFNYFGTSAKFIDALRNAGITPINSHNLSNLRTISSTGSPLADENFRFVYSHIKNDIHLASMSGGTDIAACFVLGIPIQPVFIGEIQGPALGMATDVWSDEGKPMKNGKGELVCYKSFPSMPIMFWNDADGSKYHDAYFDRFENIWCHGDFAEWTPNGGMIIHGRSDATLNPGGVRIGTAEIYNIVEQMEEVQEAICIGQKWEGGQGDVRVVLFVVLTPDFELDEKLISDIKRKIRNGASPRHVPSHVIGVEDIPRTKSGKITELAVRDVVHGREVKNKEALANPQALDLFAQLPQLR